MDQVKIGRFIAELRKEHNMTQMNLAEKLGITDRAISKWENGRGLPDVSLMKPLCEVLGITVSELLSGERTVETDNKVEDTIYEVLSDREIQVRKGEGIRKKYSVLRIGVMVFGCVIGLVFAAMIFSGLRGEGYTVYTLIQTQKAKMVSNLIEKENYECAAEYIGFSGSVKEESKEKWIEEMQGLGEKIRIDSIVISPIMLYDYFPMGEYYIVVYDLKSDVSHIYEGVVTYQNGGITFANVNISNGSTDAGRDAIGYMLNRVFSTYNPG